MACDLKHVGLSTSACTENFSGVGKELYIFRSADLAAAPTYSETEAAFEEASFAFAEGKGAYRVKLKKQSGKVTSTSNANAGGFSNVFTGVVATDMETMSLVARSMNNDDEFGAMVADGQGGYYVIYDPTFGCTFSMESDTGDAPDSDHGHTLTITSNPMRYALCKWNGKLTIAGEEEAEAGA